MSSRRVSRRILLAALLPLIALPGCGGGGGAAATGPGPNPPSTGSQGLTAFASDVELERFLKAAILAYGASPAADLATTGGRTPETLATSTAGNADYSMTNLQEAAVDEADSIKSNGAYLYVAPAPPPSVWSPMGGGAPAAPASSAAIRVLRLTSAPAAVPVTTVALPSPWSASKGLYLVEDRGPGLTALLVAIGSSADPGWTRWGNAWSWAAGSTELVIFELSKPAAPVFLTRVTVDGHFIASRRIGDVLHLVTRHTPRLPGFDVSGNPGAERANQQLVGQATLDALLPGLSVNGAPRRRLLQSQRCFVPGLAAGALRQPTMMTVTSLSLASPEQPVSSSVVGETETVYASSRSLVLATTVHGRTGLAGAVVDEPTSTDLHSFTFGDGGAGALVSARVEGSLGWDSAKRPYRFSEYEGVLRVVVSLGNDWDGSATTRLLLLKRQENSFVELSRVSGIGLPGERLYAARFAGPTAYLVTFRVTDPLYVYDLSDPLAPRLRGELHVDGFSDYLHPVGPQHLLGVGKAAVPDARASDFGGRGAWYQGVKLSLFDVSLPEAPREVRSIVLGKRGTECGVARDPHAFAFLPENGGRPARVALPVSLADTKPSYSPAPGTEPWTHYDYTHTGLYLFEVTTGAAADLRHHGTLVSEVAPTSRSEYSWFGPSGDIGQDRAILTAADLHYVHQGQIWSAPWTSPASFTGPQ